LQKEQNEGVDLIFQILESEWIALDKARAGLTVRQSAYDKVHDEMGKQETTLNQERTRLVTQIQAKFKEIADRFQKVQRLQNELELLIGSLIMEDDQNSNKTVVPSKFIELS